MIPDMILAVGYIARLAGLDGWTRTCCGGADITGCLLSGLQHLAECYVDRELRAHWVALLTLEALVLSCRAWLGPECIDAEPAVTVSTWDGHGVPQEG